MRRPLIGAVTCLLFALPTVALGHTFSSSLGIGSTGDDVTALQQLLAQDASIYPDGIISGYFGQLTAAAVERFQCAHGIACMGTPASTGYGAIGPLTRTALNALSALGSSGPAAGSTATAASSAATSVSISRALGEGSVGSDVTALQQLLYAFGYLPVSPTGYFGQLTAAAIAQLQRDNGLESVGSVGPLTRALLARGICGRGGCAVAADGSSKPIPASPPESSGSTGTVISTPSAGGISIGGGGGGSPAPAAPTLTFSADATAITSGGSATVAWSAGNAASCVASGDWSGSKGTSGSFSTGNLPVGTTTYALECHGSGGSILQSVTIITTASPAPADTAPPAISHASPSGTLPADTDAATLTVSTDEAALCAYSTSASAAYASMTPFPTTGGISHAAPLTGLANGTAYAYAVKCKDAAGNISDPIVIAFSVASPTAPAPSATISVSPSSVPYGGSAMLSWSSANASTCTASGSWSGSKATSGTQALSNLTSNGTYTLACSGTGGSATRSATVAVTGSAPDTAAPSAPSGLSASAVSASKVTLSWSASSDNVGVTGYRVYRNGALVGSPSGTSYADSGLSAGTGYSYAVKAADAAGNLSAASNSMTISTSAPADATPPVVTITGPVASLPSGTAQAALTASTNEAASCRYSASSGASFSAMASFSSTGGTAHAATLSGLASGMSYTYYVKCQDAAGNISGNASVSFSVAAAAATQSWTNTAISQQTGTFTAAFDATPTQNAEDTVIGFSSAAASAYADLAAILRFNSDGNIDARNGGIYAADALLPYAANVSYHVRMVIDTATHAYSVYITAPGKAEVALATGYAFRSEQAGAASLSYWSKYNNVGDVSISGMSVVSAQDTALPSAPANLTASAASQTQINLSWSASSDNVGVTGYRVYRNGALVGSPSGTSYADSGLSAGTGYSYAVKAADAAGNLSAASNSASATTQAPSGTGGAGGSSGAPVATGQQLTAAMVGPGAIGITSFVNGGAGGSINESSSQSWIQHVSGSATYGGFTVNGPHLLIRGVSFTDYLDISSSIPVVILGDRIRNGGYWSVFARSGAPVYVLYSDLGGTSISNPAGEIIQTGNDGHNVFARNYMSYGGDAFSMGSQDDQVIENYMEKFSPANGAHNDGIQATGNNNGLLIARNKILVDNDETSCINLGPWGGGVAQSVTIESNYFAGGGYIVYGGEGGPRPSSDIVVRDNLFGTDFYAKGGYWGTVAYWEDGNGNAWSGNVWASGPDAGKLVNDDGSTGGSSVADTALPSAPANLTASAASQTQINLSWSASSDNVGVTGYRVYRNGALVGSPSGTSYADSGLSAGTGYSYAVKAADAAGNLSAASNSASATTQAPSGAGGSSTGSTLSIDASSPGAVKGTATTLTTPSFTPPAGSELYIVAGLNTNGGNNALMSISDDRSSSLSYTRQLEEGTVSGNDALAYLYTAPVTSSVPMTVSITQKYGGASDSVAYLKVLVVDGANQADPVGAMGGGRGEDGTISDGYAATAAGSLGWLFTADWAASAVPAPGSGASLADSYSVSGQDTYALIRQDAAAAAAGSPVTLSTIAPSSGAQIAHLYFEMSPSAQSAYLGFLNLAGAGAALALPHAQDGSASQIPDAAPAASIGMIVKATDAVRVRSTPGGTAIGTEPRGAIGVIIGTRRDAVGYAWLEIAYRDGLTGWSALPYLAVGY